MDIKEKGPENVPERSKLLSWNAFIEATAVHPSRLGELVEQGWICPQTTSEEEYLFQARDVYRLRKLERLIEDLGVNVAGGCIIVDLVERIENLEQKVEELERLS